ncbi:hypothetical protein H1P_460006 [Hyella patelloides LEGE 07179]|uniref:Uncharacterized protein n=1 Tax=Hyella patelloides LEGE 07179 TaxID=945734 RepID=A0A563VYH6_9CYAN|nr:hypothetical protein H1P_460006 [Hyella patelloides LEGE 07179]
MWQAAQLAPNILPPLAASPAKAGLAKLKLTTVTMANASANNLLNMISPLKVNSLNRYLSIVRCFS